MYLEINNTSRVFTGTPTSEERRKALTDAGFVHVTGLSTYTHAWKREYVIGEKLTTEDVGKWDSHNGMMVLITNGGEVWLRAAPNSEKIRGVLKAFAPNGQGAFVPLSNGEVIEAHEILTRIVDPYSGLIMKTSS